jgi:hypothetical protein
MNLMWLLPLCDAALLSDVTAGLRVLPQALRGDRNAGHTTAKTAFKPHQLLRCFFSAAIVPNAHPVGSTEGLTNTNAKSTRRHDDPSRSARATGFCERMRVRVFAVN